MLPDGDKTKEQLSAELAALRLRIAELEKMEAGHKPADDKLPRYDYVDGLVGERTAELKALNWHLQQQITERKKAEEALERASKDLQLVSLVNNVANQGYSLPKILQLVVQETKKIFSCNGATFYAISEDKKYLVMQNLNLPQKVASQVERLIGVKIPAVRIRLDEGSLYFGALQAGKPQLVNDPEAIRGLMAECTENRLLKKLVPRIHQLLGTASVMQAPLISEGEVIGLLDISRKRPFTELELERFAAIAQQLIIVLKRKQAEDGLRKIEQEKSAILNSMSEHVVYQDTKHRVLWTNEAAAESVGLAIEQLVGKYCYEIWPQRGEPCVGCPVAKARKSGKPQEAEIITPDGRAWFIRGYPMRDANDNLVGVVEVTLDITERKRVEEKLKESEEFSSSLLNNAPNPMIVINPDTSVKYVNPALEKLAGFSSAEIIGRKAPYLWWTEETLQKTSGDLKQAMRQGAVRLEELFKKKNGERFWVEITSAPVRKVGELKYYLANWIDITERKKAEEKRQTILKTALDGFWLTSLEGKILEVNDSYCKMVGYTREELLKMYIRDIEAIESPEEVAQHIKKVVAQGYDRFETRHKRKDGQVIDVEMSINYLDVGAGQFFVFARDITERKKAGEALRESEEKYRGLVTNVRLGVFRSTPEPGGRFLEVNPAMEEITGYSREELLEMDVADLYVNPREREVILEEIASGKGRPTREARLRRKDGTEIVVADTKVAVGDDTGKVIYFDGILEDITERKQAEEREKALQEELNLASRLAAVGELAAGVAHEMNNPLTGILGFSERLSRKSTDGDTKESLELIHYEAQRLAKVVKNLLTFARRREPKKEYADINDILQRTLDLRAYELKTGNIEVALELAPNLPQIMVDFHQIQEVFVNIILNAEQVMTEASGGGKLTIKTRQIKDYIRISFTDDGPGIPAKDLGKVFNPFFTTKGERGGTGLGLSVCHGIVTEHGGRIYARSRPGSGATFLVDLPLTNERTGESQIAKEQLAV